MGLMERVNFKLEGRERKSISVRVNGGVRLYMDF